MSENDIVISGISGRYPECDNVEEFWQKLISGQELSSIDEQRWPIEFYINNVISTISLEDVIQNIPEDACVVEISQHPMLVPLIEKSLNQCLYVKMINANSENEVVDILNAIGEIYISGQNLEIENLYPKVKYPVSRETASLSHLIKWDHSHSYFVAKFPDYFYSSKRILAYDIDFMKNDAKFMVDHCIDGRSLFPATAYLFYIWFHLATEKNDEKIEVEFKNVTFHRAIIIQKDSICTLEYTINKATKKFLLYESGSPCVSGTICEPKEKIFPTFDYSSDMDEKILNLETKDVYKELRVRGYDYGSSFQGVVEAASDGSRARVKWTGNWISFADAMLHPYLLASKNRNLCVPTFIEYLRYDPKELFQAIEKENILNVSYDKYANAVYTNGVFIKGLVMTPISRRQDMNGLPCFEEVSFVPFDDHIEFNNEEVRIAENYINLCVRTIKRLDSKKYKIFEDRSINMFDDTFNANYSLYNKLKEALKEKKQLDELLRSLKDEDKQLYFLKLSYKELIKDRINTMLENITDRNLKVVEYNKTPSKINNDVSEIANKYGMKCEYIMLPTEKEEKSLPLNSTDVNFVIFKDSSAELMLDETSQMDKDQLREFLASTQTILRTDGFLLCYYRRKLTNLEKELFVLQNKSLPKLDFEQNLNSLLKETKFKKIFTKSDHFGMVSVLLKKDEVKGIIYEPIVIETQLQEYDWIETIKNELKIKQENRIWLKAKESEISGVIGLTRCLRREPGKERIRCLIADEDLIPLEVLEKDLAINLIRNGTHGNYAIDTIGEETKEIEHAFLDVKTKGDLTSFKWFEAPHKHYTPLQAHRPNNDHVLVHVYYAALNFKDVMVATGRISTNAYPDDGSNIGNIGFEFSGIDENGNRICGCCLKNAMATTMLLKNSDFVLPVPENWTLEDAATIPVVYATVYYGLLIRATLRAKEKVLIHAGSGGVGQAAINVCLGMGCEVYTSVGTEEKKKFLQSLFPQLQDKHFVNSRDVNFEEHILKETSGKGVDVILNSLAEEKLRSSINCLAEFGRF
ncbi:fatty acid synthase-like protein, partial [Dinothrombium tinctorium]